MKITAENLKEGSFFKFTSNQRKWRHLQRKVVLPNSDKIPESDKGKLLMIFDGCAQQVVSKDLELLVMV